MGFLDLFRTKSSGSAAWVLNRYGDFIPPGNSSDTYIDNGYKKLPNVYSIISLILSKSTIVPFEVYKVKNAAKERAYKAMMHDPRNYAKALKTKEEAYDKVEGSDIEKLLLTPNEYQSLEQLWWDIDGYKMLTGNSYLYHIGAGKSGELHSIPSPCVEMNIGGRPFDPMFRYKVSYLNEMIDGEEIMHFKYWNPINGTENPAMQYKGMSPLQSSRLLLGRYADADITQGYMFKNMGPGGLLTGDGDANSGFGQEQAISLQDRFKQQHTGVHKANDIVITPNKMAWTQIGLSPVDLNIKEGKHEMLGELCNVYNVPIGMFSDNNSTENNMVESRKEMITDAVIPIVEARKSVLNKFIKNRLKSDLVIEFDYSVFHELQEDIGLQADAASKMWWISANEKRALTGYDQDPDPLMDKKYLPSGLTTMEEYGMQQIDETILPPDAEQ